MCTQAYVPRRLWNQIPAPPLFIFETWATYLTSPSTSYLAPVKETLSSFPAHLHGDLKKPIKAGSKMEPAIQ